MNVGLDYIATVGGGGNATYSRHLIEALTETRGNRYLLLSYLHDVLRGRAPKHTEAVTAVAGYVSPLGLPLPGLCIEAANGWLMRRAVRQYRPNAVHFTNPLNFVRVNVPTIVTVHDLAPLHEERWTKPGTADAFKALVPRIVRHTAKFIAVSEYTKRDMIETLGIDPSNITVVFEAAGKEYYPDQDPPAVRAIVGDARYFLYAGQLQPRKNVLGLLAAFARVHARASDTKLVLVGRARDPHYAAQIDEALRAHGLAGAVVRPGYLPQPLVRKLYSGAVALVYPSFFEGFGLPILESLQCGTPAIASDATSLPEVVGDAGLLINPLDETALAEAMLRMLEDAQLRARLRTAALPHAARFSWEKVARETEKVYAAA